MAVYKVNGQELHVVEEGSPQRQVALLIHGWSSSWYAMSPLIGLLSQRFRCLAVDLPGYGQSPPPDERITILDYADLLAEFIAQVSDGPVVLIGHSMGGMISVTIAERHPVLVERMVLLNPTITGKLSMYINSVITPIFMMERIGVFRFIINAGERLLVGISDNIMRPASFAERTDITEEDYKRIRSDTRRPGQARTRGQCFFAMRENDLTDRLRKIQTPALVIWGAEDNTVPLRDAGVVADEWPGADLRILPNAGHWPQFEAPDNTRRLIASYLGLPLSSDKLHVAVGDDELMQINEIAQFLAHSDIGNNLNMAQRIRVAAQCQPRHYVYGEYVVKVDDPGTEFYVIHSGSIEVWNDPDSLAGTASSGSPANRRHVADLRPGQMTGEIAMFDEGARSADLIAGKEGVTVLAFPRDRILALCEDDAVLGTQLLWNISTAVMQRMRFILWQLHRMTLRVEAATTCEEDQVAEMQI